MKEINLRDYYPFYTSDVIVEVPDEVALLLREYTLLEEAYRIRTYRYQAFYSLEGHEGIMIRSENEPFVLPVTPKSFSNPKGIQLHVMKRNAKIKSNLKN